MDNADPASLADSDYRGLGDETEFRPCVADAPVCRSLNEVTGKDCVARGNGVPFWGHDGLWQDVAARDRMRVSQKELNAELSTDFQPV